MDCPYKAYRDKRPAMRGVRRRVPRALQPNKPIAIRQSDACDTLLIADANTGNGIRMGYELDWQIDPEDGNLNYDAEKTEGMYGGDEDGGKQTACQLRV